MNLDLEAMKAAALAATPGEWKSISAEYGYQVLIETSDGVQDLSDVDHAFLLAANPAAVLALIERLERTERNRDMWKGQCERQAAKIENLREQAQAAHDAAHAIGMAAGTSVTDLPSAVRGLIEQRDEARRELEAANERNREYRRMTGACLGGETITREEYPGLFAAADKAAKNYSGGDFKLPDLRGAFLKRTEPDCWKCHRALVAAGTLPAPRMILCPTCGNKRCPKASDHTLACTGSNEPGQPGSVY